MEMPGLSEQLSQQDVWEWAGLITGILYVFFASKQKSVCWVFGIISSACIAWKSYSEYRLMADVVLQVFYILIGFYGLWQWIKGQKEEKPKSVITSPMLHHVIWIWVCILISIPVSWWLIRHAGARYGYIDTVLTTLSVFATFLLVKKDLHNWIYWMVIDTIYLALYFASGAILFMLLYVVYALVSFYGYRQWKAEPAV